MLTMNTVRLGTIPAVLFFVLLLAGCKDFFHPDGSKIDESKNDGNGKTQVCFINGNDFSVTVYSDSSRLVKFTDVETNAESEAIETMPSAGAVFYLSYSILIDDVMLAYDGPGLAVRIDAEKTTRITIPLLSELDADELAKPVAIGVYIKIQNAGTSALVLRHGASEAIPQGANSSIINSGETARYVVSGGPVSGYSFMKNIVDPVAFPAGLTDFVPGRLYSFKFDGNTLTLLANKPLTIAQALLIAPLENINAMSLANGHISLTWDRVGTETGYVIYRSESPEGTYTSAGRTDVNSYTDTEVVIENTYYYRISAVKNNIESEKSNAVVSAHSEIISLASPEGLTVTAQTENSISLSWQAVSDATSYKVYKGSSSGAVNEYVAEIASTAYTVTGLAANTSYYFAVSAAHESRESLPSNAAQGKTSLASPRGLSVTGQTRNSISLSWQAAPDATDYKVYKGSSSDKVNDYVGETSATSYIVTGLTTGTSYYFSVRAVYENGESLHSAAVQGKTSSQYMVTFNADEGSPATQTRVVGSGGTIMSSDMPNEPTRAGHIFDGWYTEADGKGSEFSAATTVTGNITVYAWWSFDTSIQYMVIFDAEGGSPATQTRTVTNGNSLGSSDMPSAPTKSGYSFGGWYTAVNGGGSEFIADTPVTAAITLHAWWKYTVSFDAAGGSPATQTRTAGNGGSLGFSGMPPAPTMSGYRFGGWYTAVNGGGSEFTAVTTVTGNMTVYAWWTTYSYTVSFDKNGGDTEANPTTKIVTSPATSINALPAPPARTSYIFDGWYTDPDDDESVFTASTTVTDNTTVYARWTGETYTVIFKSNYGANETLYTKTVTVPATTITDFPANPSRIGYSFGGWNTQADGGGSVFTASTMVSGNITIHAQWTLDISIQYTVTFDGAGGIPTTQTLTVTNGSSLGSDMPSAPERSGYTFEGWYTATNDGGTQITASTVVISDITVYAKWTITPVPSDLFLDQALTWLSDNAVAGGSYTITLKRNETIGPKTLYYGGKNVGITLQGDTTKRMVSLSTTGSLFAVGGRVTLTLRNNVTLQGRSDNIVSLVSVSGSQPSPGTLVMASGVTISGNTGSYGGRVHVGSYGIFIMSGGTISGNNADRGGGVAVVGPNAQFTMSGGTISGNTASYGGGVYAYYTGIFTMSDGTISGNNATYGGGVHVNQGNLNKQAGGTIYGSNASDSNLKNIATGDDYGHAVYVNSSPVKKRNTTVGSEVTLNSSTEGGWE
jgi:uncharacterized repeat protein (TIGR02543 family)